MDTQTNAVQRVIFLHIPKTAGTTFMDLLKANYGQSCYRLRNGGDVAAAKRQADQVARWVQCVAGHVGYGAHEWLPGLWRYVSFLREPVDRVVSLYYYIRGRPKHKRHELALLPLHEFVKSDAMSDAENGMTRFLAGRSDVGIRPKESPATEDDLATALRRLDYMDIGITEHYGESVAMLCRRLGWRNVVTTPKLVQVYRPRVEDLTVKDWIAIREKNELDIRLYMAACRKLEASLASVR